MIKSGQAIAHYKVKEATPAQLEEMKTELAQIAVSEPHYDERIPLKNDETVWAGYTYLLDGQPTQAPGTMTVGEWLKSCLPGSVISKCDVFARGLAERRYSYVDDDE